MRCLRIPEYRMLAPTLQAAFDDVFSPATVREVHGPSTRVGPFADGSRTLTFDIDVSNVPLPIRCFFCGRRARVTTVQTVHRAPDELRVTNSINMHFVGAELFSVQPTFWLRRSRDDDRGVVVLGGEVGHAAKLPPLVRGLAERFMAAHSERELRAFERVLQRRGALAP